MYLFASHFNPLHVAFDSTYQLVMPSVYASVLHLYRVGYIDTLQGPQICAVEMKGLLKVVPEHSAGDRHSDYWINGFAIDWSGELLHDHQKLYPTLCRKIIFVKTHQLVSDEVGNHL